MRRMKLALAAAMVAALVVAAPAGAAVHAGKQLDAKVSHPGVTKSYALVQLKGAPLSTYSKTRPPHGKKVNFNSDSVKSYRAHLAAQRNAFKKWLKSAAPKAQVVKGYDLALNAVAVKLNGTRLATIRRSSMVARVEYEGLYHPTEDTDPDLAAISAIEGWSQAGVTSEDAGAGVKVGVIDTGIDISHSCFSDLGYDNHFQLGDKKFTNNKVIVARVFYNKVNKTGFTAEAIQSHGTHVAGTIACNWDTSASVNGAEIPHGISGVAPAALLGSYNVFPGNVENARSEDILDAIEAAYRDGMDIVNMSLGGGASGKQDLLTMAVDNLDKANMVFAISAGNEGPGHYTVGSPGSAKRALTAGASTVDHEVANPVTAGKASTPGVLGDFGVPSDYPLKGTLRVIEPTTAADAGPSDLSLACSPVIAAPDAKSIALIQRGVCDFSVKLDNVQKAGYIAGIVVNKIEGAPIAMGTGSASSPPTIPGLMISMDDADAFKAEDGSAVSIGAPAYVYPYFGLDVMADFSSQGPTDVTFRVKPDVVAPGVNVLSSIPTSYCGGDDCFAFFQGTSMAAPHLAGVAAIIVQQHPTWPASAVRSAVVNTADTGVLEKYTLSGPVTDVNIAGAGRVNLESAAGATALLDPVSISFGAVPSGSGVTRTVKLRITNAGATDVDWDVAIAPYGSAQGVAFSASVATVSLAAGRSAVISVKAVFNKKAKIGDKQAWLVLSDGTGMVAHAAVYARVK